MTRAALGLVALAVCAMALWLLRPALPNDVARQLVNFTKLDTIVVFGTSLSGPPYIWPDTLGAALATCRGTPVEIIRIAKPGAGSDWAKTQTAPVITAQPDLIIIEFAINDADLFDGISRAESHENHRAILTEFTQALPQTQILLVTTGPVQGMQRIKRYFLGRYFRVYSSLSAEFDTGLIHTHSHWPTASLPDGLHPQNGDANAVMVPQLLETLTAKPCAETG
jgi:acyl-CoA thioesterase-1